jgi:hypothetical protein
LGLFYKHNQQTTRTVIVQYMNTIQANIAGNKNNNQTQPYQ